MIPLERITHAVWCHSVIMADASCSCDRRHLARRGAYAVTALVIAAIAILALLAKVLA